ncbi:hypothetical protein LTR96_005586 [Exophiala xenobiotica]|nr:hypothetical protein LTR96_005586 [Exophiala xenobiotica]KAK5337143.1 hypothetical protein LTR98_006258 [Exophiala xenobiotica]KAK5450733.1 hypothetical protein LTR18_000749 [Exophiala xenobiotica]
MSHDIGLNVDPSNWDISVEDRNRRLRLWWMVYMHDKWAALALGRPSYINEDNFNVPLPSPENFQLHNYGDCSLPGLGILQFVGMAHLTTILSDVLATFYSLRASERLKSYPPELLQTLSSQFEQRLKFFHDEHLAAIYDVEGFLDPTGTIFLAYHTVQITLYRALLRYIGPEDINYYILRNSATGVLRDITSLLQKLTVRRLRAFWWGQISNHNFAIAGGFMMSLLLTSIDDAEVHYWTSQIKLYHDLLQSQSVSFTTTKMAACRMSLLRQNVESTQGVAGSASSLFAGSSGSKQAFCGDFRIDVQE